MLKLTGPRQTNQWSSVWWCQNAAVFLLFPRYLFHHSVFLVFTWWCHVCTGGEDVLLKSRLESWFSCFYLSLFYGLSFVCFWYIYQSAALDCTQCNTQFVHCCTGCSWTSCIGSVHPQTAVCPVQPVLAVKSQKSASRDSSLMKPRLSDESWICCSGTSHSRNCCCSLENGVVVLFVALYDFMSEWRV